MMLLQTDTMACKSRHGVISSGIFHQAVFSLLLTCFDGSRSQVVGESQPMMAMVGDDITLPCHAKPASDAVYEMLEWSRPDLKPRFVHVRRAGKDRLVDQNPSYKGRTSVFVDRLKQGDMSLKLSKVKLSDEGTYRCFVPGLSTESSVQLIVDEFFTESSHSYTSTIIAIVFAILFVLVAAFVVWKWRQNRTSNKKSHEDEERVSGLEKKNNTSTKVSELEPLMERETDKGKMEKLEKEEDEEKNNKSWNKELGHFFPTEEEIKQERHMRQSETNISPARRNRKCEEKSLNVGTGSKFVIDDERQQETYVSPGGDMKTVMEQKPSPPKTEAGQEEGDAKDKTTSSNNESAGKDATNDKTQKKLMSHQEETRRL